MRTASPLLSNYGLVRDRSPATLNNVSFAALHVSILLTGCWPALRGRSGSGSAPVEPAPASGAEASA